MKNKIKRISAVVAMAMTLTMFSSLSVLAEDAAAASNTPIVLAASSETTGEQGGTGSSQETIPQEVSDATITSYFVTMIDGADEFWGWGERANVTIELTTAVESAVSARFINNAAFNADSNIVQGEVSSQGNRHAITFKNVKYNGGGNTLEFELTVAGHGVFNLSQTIAQCYDVNPNPPTPEPTAVPEPTAKPEYDYPKIIVKDFSFGGTSVEAGKEFTLDLVLFTTSGDANLEDVMVGLNFGEAKNVSLASGSMNTYVGAMAPNTTKTISYKMMTDATIEPGAININVNLSSKNGETIASPISIPVVQPERFDITNMEAPETIMMGEEGYLSVTFVNKGKSAINNLSAEIQGENLANPGQSQFLGNIAAGTENSVDFSVVAQAEGTITGKVILSYEDAKGETKTLEKDFSCTVEPGMSMDDMMGMPSDMMDDAMAQDVQPGMPIWGWILIVVGVCAVVTIVIVVVRKKRKAAKLAQLEDEDEDI